MKSYFIDNKNKGELAKAINSFLKDSKNDVKNLDISTAFFTASGLRLISSDLHKLNKVRILLGAEPVLEGFKDKEPGDPEEPEFTKKILKNSLENQLKGLENKRNKLPFNKETYNSLNQLVKLIKSKKIESKRYQDNFLHAKAYIFHSKLNNFIVGSSNLTAAGLKHNLELNIGIDEKKLFEELSKWYEDLWSKSVPFDLIEIFKKQLVLYQPYEIFLKILHELYGAELEEETKEDRDIQLAQFQLHGVQRAKKLIKKYHGALIADGVGLGKTHMACEIIKSYLDNRQKTLVLCPAAVVDSWERHLLRYIISAEVSSYQKFANHMKYEETEGKQGSVHLSLKSDDYAFLVLDEAHNYRNPEAPTLAKTLDKFLLGKRRDVLELTATPVNNSLWDLHYVLRYFLKQDSALVDIGIRSIKDEFQTATDTHPFDLNPDTLYPIIDATTVKRPRRFIKKYYPKDTIPDEEGKLIPIKFPKPIPQTLKYEFNDYLVNFMEKFEDALMPEAPAEPLLKLTRYKTDLYLKSATKEERIENDRKCNSVDGLIRTSLLKRLESSIQSFRTSIKKMIVQHEIFLEAIKKERVISTEFFREYDNDDDNLLEAIEEFQEDENAVNYNIKELEEDIEHDLNILKDFDSSTSKVSIDNDAKLMKLKDELINVLKEAEKDAPIKDEIKNYRKVLIFSYFKDTVEWIHDYLVKEFKKDKKLAVYKNRFELITGSRTLSGKDKDVVISAFAPESTKAPVRDDKYDLIVCSDVLAEGLNLHQCRNIINYDLPWNPMRLVQRHGRIDRINSQYDQVYLKSFFPEKYTERLLRLVDRIRRKLAMAARTVGEEAPPIVGGEKGTQVFSDTIEIEELKKENATIFEQGGTRSAAQSSEEYRQILRQELERGQFDFEKLPWHAGSFMKKGEAEGYVFLAKIGNKNFLRFIPHKKDEKIIREMGTCLRYVECEPGTPLVQSKKLNNAVFDAWDRAQKDIYDEWTFFTDPKNLQPKVRKINRDIQEHLSNHHPTNTDDKDLNRALECLLSPCSVKEERILRAIYKDENISPTEKSKLLVEKIKEIGLEPYKKPDTYPTIDKDMIHLVCWIGLTK